MIQGDVRCDRRQPLQGPPYSCGEDRCAGSGQECGFKTVAIRQLSEKGPDRFDRRQTLWRAAGANQLLERRLPGSSKARLEGLRIRQVVKEALPKKVCDVGDGSMPRQGFHIEASDHQAPGLSVYVRQYGPCGDHTL